MTTKKTRKKPITQRWPGQWVLRGKIWDPDRGFLDYQGSLNDPLGPIIKILMVIAFCGDSFMTRKMKGILDDALAKITAEMARVNKSLKAKEKRAKKKR